MERINELEEMLAELRRQKFQLEEELPKAKEEAEKEMKRLQKKIEEISLQKSKAEQETKRYRIELDDVVQEKEAAEEELERVKQLTLKAEAQRTIVEENLRAFRIQLEDSDRVRKTFEDHLRKKDTNLQDLEQQKKALMEELKKKTAEEEKLMKLIKEMERDLELQGSLGKSKFREKEITEVRRQITLIGRETLVTGTDIFREKQEIKTIDEYQQLVDELTFAKKKSEKIIKDLKYELNELELQNASSEEKARLLKEKLDEANNSLRYLKIEMDQKELVEQGYLEQLKELDRQLQKTTCKAEKVMQEVMDLKKINMKYQEELKSLQKEKVQLKRELEELARTHTQNEITIQQLNVQISSLQQEKMVAEQRTISFRGEASNLQEQFRKMQEQLLQKTREEKESQFNIQRLKDDLADSKHMVEKLKQKVEELNRLNSETKIMMTEVRTESEKVVVERQIIDRKNDELKSLIESFKEQLRVTNEELHKQIIIEQEHLDKIKRLEDELIKTKDLANDFKQKCDRENAYNMNAEMEVRNLSSQLNTCTMEIKMCEQKIQQQQAYIQELNSKMKKQQDDFHQKTLDEQMARKKIALLQEESIKFKHSAEEFKKKFEKLLESHNIAENDISGIRMECITLQQERHMTQENIRMYKIQIEDLQDRLQKCREQLQQGKHAETEYLHKYRKLEEELHIQKRTIENLKHQIDMQKREHCNQLRMFQNEINKKNIQLDFGWKGNGFSYMGDTSPREFEKHNLCTTTSPLLRRRQIEISTPGCKTEQLVTTGSLPREKSYQLSGITNSLENGVSQQSYAEYVSQTSTQLEITIDKNNPLAGDSKFLSSRHEDGYELGLGKHRHPLEKSVEEEKKEHVEKAGDLLKWVSNVTKSLREGGGGRSEKADLLKKQISADDLSMKKEQISEALQTTQTFLAKHGDKMTEEEKNEMENHVKSLQEGYKLLSNEDLKQLQEEQNIDDERMDEKVDKVIAGIIDQTTGEKFSVLQAVYKGLLDYDTGIQLLQAQLILSGLISPTLRKGFDLEEAKANGLVDDQAVMQLQDLQNAKSVLSELQLTPHPVVAALEKSLISESLAIKILEIQFSTGHISIPGTEEHLTVHHAFQKNLISAALYTKLLERQDMCRDLIDPNTAERLSLEELLDRTVIHEKTSLRFLPVMPQERGRIMLKSGRKITVLRAAHEGLIERETMFRLLGAQLFSGGIIHPHSGHRMTVEEAMGEGLIDQDTACAVLTHQVQTGGIQCPNSSKRLTVDEAVQCNLISSRSALLVLEAQRNFVGLLWPHNGEIFPISTSLHQDMITNELACKILNGRQKIAALYIPETCEVISLENAAQQGIIDSYTSSILCNLTLPDEMPNMDDLPFPLKRAARWFSSCELHPSFLHKQSRDIDSTSTSDPKQHHFQQAQKLFMSYLMINSYMDANSGHRLLLHCGDLNETVKWLRDGSSSQYNTDGIEGQSCDFCINPKSPDHEQNSKNSSITGNDLIQDTGIQNISRDDKKKEFHKDDQNSKHLKENNLSVVTGVSDTSEYLTDTLFSKKETKFGEATNAKGKHETESLLESSEEIPMKIGENITKETDAGSDEVRGCPSNYFQESNPSIINEHNIGVLEEGKVKEKENIMSVILDNHLDASHFPDINTEGKAQGISVSQRGKCHNFQTEEEIVLMEDEVKEEFCNSTLEHGNKLLKTRTQEDLEPYTTDGLLQPEINNAPLLHNYNKNSGCPLQAFIDTNSNVPLEDSPILHDACPPKDSHYINGRLPQDLTKYVNPPLKDTADRFTVQDKSSLEACHIPHSTVQNNQSMPVLEKDSPDINSLYEDNMSLINGLLKEQRMEIENREYMEKLIITRNSQQLIEPADLHSTSHTNFDRNLLLKNKDDKSTMPIQRLPLEDVIDRNNEFIAAVSFEFSDEISINITPESEPRTSLEVDTGMKNKELSLGDYQPGVALGSLILEGSNIISQPENDGDYKDSTGQCHTTLHKDVSETYDATQTHHNNGKVCNLAKMNNSKDVTPEPTKEAIKVAAEKPVHRGPKYSQVNLNDNEENILCFSESNDTEIFEIINVGAFNAWLLDTQDKVEGTGDVEKKDQKKGSDDSEGNDISHERLQEAENQRVGHEEIRMKEGDSDGSEYESLCMDSGNSDYEENTNNIEGENSGDEDDFEGYDYVDFDYDTSDTTDVDEDVMEMHYFQCHAEKIGAQCFGDNGKQLSDKNIYQENNLHVESKDGFPCFENCSASKNQNKPDATKEIIYSLSCKCKDEILQDSDQDHESFMESQIPPLCITNGATLKDTRRTDDKQVEPDVPPQNNLHTDHSKVKFHDDILMPCFNNEKSQEVNGGALVQAITNKPQLGMGTPEQDNNGVCILNGKLGESFTPDIKNGYNDIPPCDGTTNIDQISDKTKSGMHSNGFPTNESVDHVEDFGLSTYLKQSAKNVKAKDILELRENNTLHLTKPQDNGKDLDAISCRNNKGEHNPRELNCQLLPSLPSVPPEPVLVKKREGGVHPDLHHDKTQNSKYDFNKMSQQEHEASNKDETSSKDQAIGLFYNTLSTVDGSSYCMKQKADETWTAPSSLRTPKKSIQLSQKDMVFLNFPPVKEQEVHFSIPATLPEGITDIFKSGIKDGRVYYKREDEPLSYIGTKGLMQNLLKMVNYTHHDNEESNQSEIKHANDSRTISMSTQMCVNTNEYNFAPDIWIDNRSPDLLLDILKQDHGNRTESTHETVDDVVQSGKDPEKRTSELDHTFPILDGTGHSLELKSEHAAAYTDAFGKTLNLKQHHQAEQPVHPPNIYSNDIMGMTESVPGSDTRSMLNSGMQPCLWYTENLRRHLTVFQDMKFLLDDFQPISNDLEALKVQLEQLESFESRLGGFAVILRKDMKLAEEFLKLQHKDIPREQLQDLKESYECLENNFLMVCEMSSKRAKQIVLGVESEMAKLTALHQEHLVKLQEFTDWIMEKNEIIKNLKVDVCDIEDVRQSFQFFKDLEKDHGCKKIQLESTAFDIQFFISEHAQDLSPNQSKQLLKLLNSTQKHFREVQETIQSEVNRCETLLQTAQRLVGQKDLEEQHQDFKEKLQDICDLLTQTENQLIGHQEALVIEDSKTELQQYQTKQQELQKTMQANTQALAEIVKNTEMFLKENGEKLLQEDKISLEKKLNEAKTKCLLLSQKAEESRKELDKAVTTAIKQETEKVAAREQLEESKNTIENLLDWLSNVDKDAEHGKKKCKPAIKQNGNHIQEEDVEGLVEEEDEVNGNLLDIEQENEIQIDGQLKPSEDNLNMQYQKAKAQHEKLISQQQAVIIATQSAQALLEKQGHHLLPEEKEKIQRNMKELKVQYDTILAESEQKLKLTRSLQEELEKFDVDYGEFESWLQQAEQELENLETGASEFNGIVAKLKRQKSFSEDVISHKGDLRYITISGQRVLDAVKSCNEREGVKYDKEDIDTSSTFMEVQNKLDSATGRFKSLYSKCSIFGNNLKDLVDKYQNYEDASSGLLSGLQDSEEALNKHLSEAVAADPKNLQRQLEETKVLQGQVSGHQMAVEKLKKAAEVLFDTRGELLPDKDEIQNTLDTIVDKYNQLSKAVNDRNEKLQITLTRSLSVQDGLDEMLDWMNGVEKRLEEQGQVPLNSAALQDVISRSMALEQDILSRQSSLNAMKEKMNKCMETADPSTASSLQAKMNELSVRFTEANRKHKEKLGKMEKLQSKVELFECLSDKLQSFLDKKTQALSEADVPGKDVTEMSQYVQETSTELMEQKKDLKVLQHLIEELSPHALPADKSLVLEKVNALLKKFKEVEEAIQEREDDVSSCQQQMDTFNLHVESLKKWIDEMIKKVPDTQPSLNTETLKKHLQTTKNLEKEWSSKAPDIQKMITRGTVLCNLISAVTSPAKSRGIKPAVSGLVLNGEGATVGNQDFLSNKELTTVHHSMSAVSSSYDDLGAMLKKKTSELESMLSNMQNVQEESNSMMDWLQKMDTATAKWETAPLDTESVKEQVDQHKLFETELKQNENKVQELKDRVAELLEKNPNSPEAPKWKQMLDKIDSKWKELSQVAADRQKKLEESSNYLTQFQTTEAQLKQWLVEKELMVSVLGPLSIDPNMLNTQKQQVQILLKEFDTRKPQYEQLSAAGQGILKKPGEHPPSHETVKQQLAAVAEKWDGLTGQLSDRCSRIDQAIVKSTEYQNCLRRLSEKLGALDDKLSQSLAISTDPDAVKQQLELAREVKEEIKKEMLNIDAAEILCKELSELVAEDYLKAELARQLDGILKPFKDMEQKAGNHIEQLQSTYVSSHQFQKMSKDFQIWLDKQKEEQNQSRPISTRLESLWSLVDDQKEFKARLSDQIGCYEKIIAEGESLLQKTQGVEKAELQSQLNLLKDNWEEMNKQVKERQDKLNNCVEKALRYKEHVDILQPWIAKCESNVSEIKMGIDPVELENSITQVKTWQKDLDKHQGIVELLRNAADTFLNACETDKDVIEEEKTLLIQKMNVATEQLQMKRDELEKMSQKLKEFQESSREVKEQLKNAREQLEVHESLKPQTYSNKHLTIMQAQQKALQITKNQVDVTKKLAQELVVEAVGSSGVSDLLLQAEALEKEYSNINEQVEQQCSFLESKLQGIGHFQNAIREMFSQFAEFDDELDSMVPVSRDVVILQSQQRDIKAFLKKLEELITSNENANKTCKAMLASEAETSPDLAGIKRDLEALNKQCNKLLDRARTRDEQIEGTINRMEEFYSKLQEFSKLLGDAVEHEESQGPVAMETETINQQLNAFKVFEKEAIEPLQVKQQEVNWLGQGLIQSAAKNTSIENLECNLEDVNTKWKTLNKKVAQRAAQLQEALLHCGRFQDAVESILCWLIDTEDLVANQKPPSAEFKVVKAQIQEQKLLQRLLDDRKPTVELIKREGEKIAESAEPADKDKILKQLNLLDSRWDALLDKAERRNRQLEGISVVAQQFHETFEPLVEWIVATEKRLSNSEPIGTQASKLQQQISQHKALEEDITIHNTNLHETVNIGQALKTLCSKEDKEMVQEKLDSSEARYTEIQEKYSSRAELLQQAYCNSQIFGEDEVELMNWLNEVHKKLSKLAVQDYNTDLLGKQHTEMLVLQEEIELRKQNVDQAIQNGLELLKQTTGDEVIIIQDKLEGIKARYKDITKLSSDVSKTLEQALKLSGQLQCTHEELCTWLDKVEVELLSYDSQVPKGKELNKAQERQKELKKEAKENKNLLDTLNEVSSALLELVPWRAREGIDRMVTEDNERYRTVSDSITQKVEEIDAAILRSQQFDQAADTELAWVDETGKKLMSLDDIRLEREQTTAQLQVQKAFTMEILKHKDTIEELVASGDEIMKTYMEAEKQTMKKKLESLVQKYDILCQMNSKRNLQLERAQSLVSQFWETYEEIWPWLTETKMVISQLPAPALEYETLKQQQEEHRQLRELIAEHKPHIDKMNKTGPQLLELSPREGFSIQEKYVAADALYSQIKEDVKKRAQALDEAISQSTQFHDKIDSTIESLERIVERLRQPPSISAEVEKIKEQISENKNVSVDLEKLQPVYETLKQRGEEMIARSEGADKDISAKVVQDKLDQMVFIWEDIHTLAEEREAKLLDAMELAEKFWCDHMGLVATIKDTQDFIRELEGAGIDPSVVKQQQEAAESIKEEVDGLQEELDAVVNLGSELIAACGEPDKPLVNKSIDELNSAWDALNKSWKERVDKLEEAMQAAVQYQDGLQAIFDWVDIAGSKLASMSPVGTDLETVKQQTEELKQFKKEAYQQQIEMERLNHQAELLLKKATEESDKHTVQEPLSELKLLWESLEDKIVSRQHKLEGALLALGQFQHALDELLTWLTHTEDLLNDQKPVGSDPKAIEIELAKHHVLQNDVLAHQSTVETVKKAGNDLIQSSAVEEASNLQSKLELLNQRWQNLLEKTEKRKQQLDTALIQAQGFHGEVEDLHQWLTETERQLLASKPVGGLPETAREQLNTHMELCAAFEAKEETYKCLMQKGLLASCPGSVETNVDQDINNLKEKWESVETKLNERKIKLEEALSLAMEFHNSLQDFINWLTQAEQTLTVASRPSLILDTVLFQIDEHKVFANEVNAHRDQIIELDKTGTHLKYFSQKQDVVLIKNLLISVQSRWEKVVQRLVERGRALDDARKRAKQFHEAWNKLTEWLDESEKTLDAELEIANDPDKIKMQLSQHKEFQKALGAKHSVYDTTNRSGRSLKEKTTLADDNLKLDDMLSELRDKWDTVCGKSVERQNKLEEALLFSGQFTDALQALIDWLYKVEPQLAEDQPVHGDIDLVINLIDSHKGFQKELGKRTSSVQALKRSARELIEGSRDDSSWVKVQMQELGTRWDTVCALSISKQTRLEQALNQAEEFHSVVHVLLEWLAEAEQALRFHGVLPDDEEALRGLIEQHREFMKKLEEKKTELNKATGMGEAILAICHPDSITTIKHWITIIRARFEEVLAWAKQHQQRLTVALAALIANQELLEALLSWLQWAEATLTEKDKEAIPQEIDDVKALIAEHQTFMEEMTRKQPDVDKVTKTHKRKTVESGPIQSHIPVLDKGRGGRKRSPTPSMYPSGAQAQIETKNPQVNLLVSKWQQVWLLALERRRKLNDALDRLEELREFANFDFDIWRKKYMRWMNHKKSRVMDFFRRIDKDQDGKITRQEFIDGILSSKFPTSRLEMSAVADIFDRDGDGYIDYYEFVAALHPNKDAYKPLTDADKIEDEVTRQVAKCKCAKRFQVEQIGDNKYRFFLGNQFGDSQQLRLVRILRSTVMVRVGGGWMALDEFLVKNDPCRVHHHGSKMLRSESNSSITTQPTIAKGRTNMELREKFILADGASQSMAAFRPRGRRSRPSSRGASPNRSMSVSNPPAQGVPTPAVAVSTPKTPHHLTRNYGKPWLINSKTSSPCKPPECSEYQVSSTEGTPIQGSKLRLPGYLSGKGFHSGEDTGLISTAATRVRAHFPDTRKTPSRPGSRAGSKAGSRASSRRGSDASDFDISEIQSVCSDVSETVHTPIRPTPRPNSRSASGKPSKIPTPQRRSPASKVEKASKR
ncbi:dystonin isoform X10 [Anolis carolinensis]